MTSCLHAASMATPVMAVCRTSRNISDAHCPRGSKSLSCPVRATRNSARKGHDWGNETRTERAQYICHGKMTPVSTSTEDRRNDLVMGARLFALILHAAQRSLRILSDSTKNERDQATFPEDGTYRQKGYVVDQRPGHVDRTEVGARREGGEHLPGELQAVLHPDATLVMPCGGNHALDNWGKQKQNLCESWHRIKRI
jgi:hypothetical protein